MTDHPLVRTAGSLTSAGIAVGVTLTHVQITLAIVATSLSILYTTVQIYKLFKKKN